MSIDRNIIRRINTFYRRWAAHEQLLGKEGAPVLDFDYCPADQSDSQLPFESRLDALKELECIFELVGDAPGTSFSNTEFLALKLRGSNAYLRALLGERIAFAKFLEATTGILPSRLSPDFLEELREAAIAQVSRAGIGWKRSELERYDSLTLYPAIEQFGPSLTALAKVWVRKLQSAVTLDIEPRYRVETTVVDEYWYNWIDGKVGDEILLRINTHPRARFRRGDDHRLAAHEIAGHAIHILSLSERQKQGEIESCLMNTTVHTAETFQFEGVAQSILHLLSEDDELSDEILLNETVNRYNAAVVNNAQISIEEGQPIDAVIKEAADSAPFLDLLSLASDLRDRSKNPFFRAYVHVYSPSMEMFLRAKRIPLKLRASFLREMYTAFWTPRQIEEKLLALTADCKDV